METIQSNPGWIIFFILAVILFLFKVFSKEKDGVTSKYIANQILQFDLNSSLALVKQALVNSQFSKIGFDPTENRYYAVSGFSMYSWSEYIQVKAVKIDNQTEIEFKSICAFPMQIFDWGKNKNNYRKFERQLKILSSSTVLA
jgi:hypothetical protein